MEHEEEENKYHSEQYQTEQILSHEKLCTEEFGNYTYQNLFNGTHCQPIWDNIMCWSATAKNEIVTLKCPSYIAGFNSTNNATKLCTENGWYIHSDTNTTWTNYTQCFHGKYATVLMELPKLNVSLMEQFTPVIKTISKIGYSVSFSTLVVAFIIMISFKKLHCARNKLHMHLFASFIFRALMALLKDILFIKGVGLSSDIDISKDYFIDDPNSNNWHCKMFTSLWQYFITANYSWILMEGLYLHNLILLALFSDSNSSILYYIVLGWGLPALVVAPWIIARITLANTFCWMTHEDNPSIFLIIRIPTMISILINLVLFINIARVLLLKLSSPISEEAQRFKRWARSTLVLVPLFGVHYAAFMGMSSQIGQNNTVEVIWLFCDQLFACFQGFFVAILYCFLNGEVRAELCPRIKSLLTNLLSFTCCQYIMYYCNCGDLTRSLKGRASVCTTLSCSSLYNSHGVITKFQNRKGRWNPPQQKTKRSVSQYERGDVCHNCTEASILNSARVCHDASHWNNAQHQMSSAQCSPTSPCMKCSNGPNCFCHNSILPITETTACLEHQDEYKQDSNTDLEMITMVQKS